MMPHTQPRLERRRRAPAVVLPTVVLLAGLSLTSCASDQPDELYRVVAEARIADGEPLPAAGAPVLTVESQLRSPDGQTRWELGIDTLEQLRTVEYEAIDDASGAGTRHTFTGVLLSDLLETLELEEATKLRMIALNEYEVDLPVEQLEELPALIAYLRDGEPMSVENLGPLRIVYPNIDVELPAAEYDSYWIWQLSSIVAS